MILIVPDNNPELEFVASDIAEAHETCHSRGYTKFDIWSIPDKKQPILYSTKDGLIGADHPEAMKHGPVKVAVYDDGSTMLESDITVEKPT
jgi:hypothetical protein